MEYPKKVWDINVPLPFPFGSAHIRRETPAPPPQPALGDGGSKQGAKSKAKGKPQRLESDSAAHLHSRWHIFFAYALGPLYPLLTGWSLGNLLWAILGLASIAAWVAAGWYRTDLLQRVEGEGVGVPILLAGVCGITLLGFTAWSRALHVAGWRMQQRALLPGSRHPGIVAVLSLLLPGFGLFISGHPRRGAFALWILGPLVIAAVILGHAPWLWHLNQGLGAGRIPRIALELVFIGSVLVALGAAFSWIIQALDGARLVSKMTGRRADGQPAAFALLAAIVVFHLAFKPASVAQVLDRFAIALRLEGLRVAPLVMELGATKLDPSQPLYKYRAAELYDKLGQGGRARRLREDLNARWNAYARTARAADPAALAAVFSPPNPLPAAMPILPVAVPGLATDLPGDMGPPGDMDPPGDMGPPAPTSPADAAHDGAGPVLPTAD